MNLKKFVQSGLLSLFVMFACSFSCAQNGPTAPVVTVSWTQAAGSGTVTANCVYRGTATGVYTLPAIFCSTTPITTFDDKTTARGNSYHYAVTAKYGPTTESPYSNDALAVVPVLNAPTINPPVLSGAVVKPSAQKATTIAASSSPDAPGGLSAKVTLVSAAK